MDETGLEKRIRTYANKAKVLTPVGSKQKLCHNNYWDL